MKEERILTPKDIAEVLGISMPTVYELIRQSDFPAVRVGKQYRVLESQFIQWMKANSGWSVF